MGDSSKEDKAGHISAEICISLLMSGVYAMELMISPTSLGGHSLRKNGPIAQMSS